MTNVAVDVKTGFGVSVGRGVGVSVTVGVKVDGEVALGTSVWVGVQPAGRAIAAVVSPRVRAVGEGGVVLEGVAQDARVIPVQRHDKKTAVSRVRRTVPSI